MITENELNRSWAGTALATKAMWQNMHYIQHAALFVIDDYPFVFKGGTCLWFFYGLPRFSEDLDFSPTVHMDRDEFPKKFALEVQTKLKKMIGIENKVIFKGYYIDGRTYAFEIVARAPHFNPTPRYDGLTRVDIHVSEKAEVMVEPKPATLEHDGYFIPKKIVSCMDQNEICGEKVQAIITRDKARDVFDLWYVITRFKIEFDIYMINTKMAVKNEKYTYKRFESEIRKKEKDWDEVNKLIFLRKKDRPTFETCLTTIMKWAEPSKNMGKNESACVYWKPY